MAILDKERDRDSWLPWAIEFMRRGLWLGQEIEVHGPHHEGRDLPGFAHRGGTGDHKMKITIIVAALILAGCHSPQETHSIVGALGPASKVCATYDPHKTDGK